MIYPIFIPSRGRPHACLTANLLSKEDIPFRIVVEPHEKKAYAECFGAAKLLILDKRDGGLAYARNFIKDFSAKQGDVRHWQLDDDVLGFKRFNKGTRVNVPAQEALSVVEQFTDRFANVALSGLVSSVFAFSKRRAFDLNVQIYMTMLVLNSLTQRWREIQEDTDYSLQVLTARYCTLLINAYATVAKPLGSGTGGAHDHVYAGDRQLQRVRDLQRKWPNLNIGIKKGKIITSQTSHIWRHFTTPLQPV